MTSKIFHGVPARVGAAALALAFGQGWLSTVVAAEETAAEPAAQTAEQPEPAAETAAPNQAPADPAQAARAAMEARHAERMARMEAHQKAMRERAAAQGIEMPEPPPMPESPRWMSYEEMKAEMERRGIDMPPPPGTAATGEASESAATAQAPTMAPPMMTVPGMGPMDAGELKQMFDVIGAMTPEQQQACFGLSRWHAATLMQPTMGPPMQVRPMGPRPGYGPGFAPGFGPGQGIPGHGPLMLGR
jgi:hypothetical protein